MKRHFAILCLFIGLFLLTSCNLLASQSTPSDNPNIEPSALIAEEQNDSASVESPIEDPTDAPESEQAPEPQEPQLPAPPILEYIYPQNLINPLLVGGQVTISYIEMIDTQTMAGPSEAQILKATTFCVQAMAGLTWTDVTPAGSICLG